MLLYYESKFLMDVSTALLTRKSVRAFLDKPVTKENILAILNHAKTAPSGTNTQPWQVAVVSGNSKQELDKLLLQQFSAGIPQHMDYHYYPTTFSEEMSIRRKQCGLQLYGTLNIQISDKEKRREQWAKNYSAFGAPVALFIFADKCIEKGSFMDCGMFIQSIMLMATSLGLATCPQAALAEQPKIVKSFLGYPDESILLCGIALGYEDTSNIVNSYRTFREDVNNFTKFFT